MKKSIPALSIFFYILAIIFLFFACFYFVDAYQTVDLVLDSGQSTVGITDILGLYITQVAPFVAYSSLLYGVGFIISKVSQGKVIFTEDDEATCDEIVEEEHLESVETEEKEVNEEL